VVEPADESRPRIRMAGPDDAAAILVIYGPFVRSTAVTFEYTVPSVAEMAERIRTVTLRWPWLVLDRDDAVAAYAYASTWRSRAAYQWAVETTVYVHPDARRQGVGRAIYRSLLACLRLQGHRMALGAITLPNSASVALHEALGFRCTGVHRACGHKLGAWHDVGMWELELAPRADADPSDPVAANSLQHTPEWATAMASGLFQGRAS
jgi:L-amino acid N-acyltransferase YncA